MAFSLSQTTLLRAAAFILDTLTLSLFLVIPATIVSYSVAWIGGSTKAITLVWYGALLVLIVGTLIRDGLRGGGGSLGKKFLGLRVLTTAGRPCGVRQSFVRNFPWLIPPWNLIEVLLMLRGVPRSGDRLAGTTIVEE